MDADCANVSGDGTSAGGGGLSVDRDFAVGVCTRPPGRVLKLQTVPLLLIKEVDHNEAVSSKKLGTDLMTDACKLIPSG